MDTRRARFQPLLLLGAVGTVLPAAIMRGASAGVVVYLVAAGLGSVLLWARHRARPMSPGHRDLAALALILAALFGLVLVVWGDEGRAPADYLFLSAAFACAVASTPTAWLRWSLQSLVMLLVVATFLDGQRSAADTIFVLVLVLAVAFLVELFARALVEARRDSIAARSAAAARAELLDAVRTLPGRSVEDAAAAVTDTVVAMGFDAAAVARVHDGFLVPIEERGELHLGAVPRGFGVAWSCIERDATSISSQLATDDLLREHGGLRSVVVSPLRVDGAPVGCLIGGDRRARTPTAVQAETVDVLAAHLSGVLAAEARRARQTELMERMAALDRMRRGLVTTVSAEVRDPLTIVRSIGRILSTHGGRVSDAQRHRLLGQLVQESDQLRQLIETLLDFSRSQAQRDDPRVRPTPLIELLAPLVESTGLHLQPSLEQLARRRIIVELDPALVRSALELLVASRPGGGTDVVPATVEVLAGNGEVQLQVLGGPTPPTSELVHSLVFQLCVAGNVAAHLGERTVLRIPASRELAPSTSSSARRVGDAAAGVSTGEVG